MILHHTHSPNTPLLLTFSLEGKGAIKELWPVSAKSPCGYLPRIHSTRYVYLLALLHFSIVVTLRVSCTFYIQSVEDAEGLLATGC